MVLFQKPVDGKSREFKHEQQVFPQKVNMLFIQESFKDSLIIFKPFFIYIFIGENIKRYRLAMLLM
jgi:hypothetical protein